MSNPTGFGAPVAASIDIEATSAAFLRTTLKRDDLVEFASFLSEKGMNRWAFTGSIALQIHGHRLGYEPAKNRIPGDVDIVTDSNGASHLGRILECDIRQASGAESKHKYIDLETFEFKPESKPTFKVDILNGDKIKCYGSFNRDSELIENVRVMTLPALLRAKTAMQEDAAKGSAAYEKATNDIEIIKALLARAGQEEPENTPVTSVQSTEPIRKSTTSRVLF